MVRKCILNVVARKTRKLNLGINEGDGEAVISCYLIRDGNGVGWGRRMGSLSPPHMVLSCPIPAPPRMTGNTFSPHPRPLGPREAPPRPIKLFFLLIYPTISTIFLIKLISLIKIHLKLQIYPIKSNQFLEKIE